MIDFAVLCSAQNYYQKTGVPNFLGKKSVTKSTRNVLLFNYLNFSGALHLSFRGAFRA